MLALQFSLLGQSYTSQVCSTINTDLHTQLIAYAFAFKIIFEAKFDRFLIFMFINFLVRSLTEDRETN